jgi:hypothetical protein
LRPKLCYLAVGTHPQSPSPVGHLTRRRIVTTPRQPSPQPLSLRTGRGGSAAPTGNMHPYPRSEGRRAGEEGSSWRATGFWALPQVAGCIVRCWPTCYDDAGTAALAPQHPPQEHPMDNRRFDLLARSIGNGSRRTLLRAALATFGAVLWLGARAPEVAAACRGAGSRCKRSSQCCSGTCRKKGRRKRKKCAPLPSNAHGCTIDDASCDEPAVPATPCPNLPNGKCRITLKGRPVCAVPSTIDCGKTCQNNQDCVGSAEGLGVGAICVRCEGCPSGTACICPFFVGD